MKKNEKIGEILHRIENIGASKKNIIFLGLAIIVVFLTAAIYGDTSIIALIRLIAGIFIASTILIYANLKFNSSREAAERLCGDIFFYSLCLGLVSLVLAISIYFPAMISLVFYWGIMLGALVAGNIDAIERGDYCNNKDYGGRLFD